jgi:hypothetical protein
MDRFSFKFWLLWILWFAGSLVGAAIFWTFVLTLLFGRIQGSELTLSWAVAVFGSWFVLLIPFMRKKEQIWKRLNDDQERAVDAWLVAMGFFIGLLVSSCLFWSWRLADRIQTSEGFDATWSQAVFGTWLFLLIPFLIWMYRKADDIMKTAMVRQGAIPPSFKTAIVEKSKRLLPKALQEKLNNIPPTLPRGHVVTVILKDGQRIPDVFVLDSREIAGVYHRDSFDFESSHVVDIKPIPKDQLPPYEEMKWLKLLPADTFEG